MIERIAFLAADVSQHVWTMSVPSIVPEDEHPTEAHDQCRHS